MSEAKHTAGPWFVVDHSKDEQCLYIESARDGIASVFTDTLTPPEQINANARLIAAAPELLGALKDIAVVVKESEGIAGYHLNGNIARWGELEAFANLDELIAKAEAGNA